MYVNVGVQIKSIGICKERKGHHFTDHIVFVPCVQRSFRKLLAGAAFTVNMKQLPFTSAKDRTTTSLQGVTLDGAPAVIDMGNYSTSREDYWLNLYVAMSRVTSLSDLFVYRSPSKDFFDAGPPAYLRECMRTLEAEDGGFNRANIVADQLLSRLKWPTPD